MGIIRWNLKFLKMKKKTNTLFLNRLIIFRIPTIIYSSHSVTGAIFLSSNDAAVHSNVNRSIFLIVSSFDVYHRLFLLLKMMISMHSMLVFYYNPIINQSINLIRIFCVYFIYLQKIVTLTHTKTTLIDTTGKQRKEIFFFKISHHHHKTCIES